MGHETVNGGSGPLGELILHERRQRSWSRQKLAELVRNAARKDGEVIATNGKSIERWELRGMTPQGPALSALASVLEQPVELLVALVAREAPEASQGLLAGPPAAPTDHEYIDSVRRTIQQLVGLEIQHGGSEIASMGVHAFRSVRRHLAAGAEPRLARDLQAAAAEMAEVAGWLLHDADRHEAARQMNNEGLYLARLAGDRSMELFILANASLLALFTRQPGEALMISEALLDTGNLTSREAVIFMTRQARALAQRGERDAALRRMDEAQATFWDGASSRDPAWAWWVDAAEVRAHIALAHADLGDHPRAAELLQRSVDDCPPQRRGARFIYLAQQLRADIQAGSWSDAETVIHQTLPYVGEVQSSRTTGLLLDGIGRIAQSGTPDRLVEASRHLATMLTAAGLGD